MEKKLIEVEKDIWLVLWQIKLENDLTSLSDVVRKLLIESDKYDIKKEQ